MSLKLTDEVAVRQKNSGGQVNYVAITEFNELISSEESEDITTDLAAAIAQLPELGIPVVAEFAEGISRDGELDEITWTAVTGGTAGNDITINIVIPETAESRAISVTGKAITVSVATELSGEDIIVSATETATAIAAAVNAHESAGLLVQGSATGTGTTVIAAESEAETAFGEDSTLAKAGKIYIDKDNDLLYICIADTDGTEAVLDANWVTAKLEAIST